MLHLFRSLRAAPLLLAAPLVFTSCKKDDADQPAPAARPMYVVNQGNFMRANADITRFDRATGAAVRAQFAAANSGVSLGDVVQSMTMRDGRGYIVVNNSGKIVVVQMSDFKQVAEITGLAMPRYATFYLGKGYVTEWVTRDGNGRVSEFDLTTNTRTGRTWPTGVNPEEIISTTAGLLVANRGGNTLTAFSPLATTTTAVPTLADCPTNLRLDGTGRLWVLCEGKSAYQPPSWTYDTTVATVGAIVSMPLSTLSAPTVRFFPRRGVTPGSLSFSPDNARLYYTYLGHVFGMSVTDSRLPAEPFIRRKMGFDVLGIDPADGTLYAADQFDYGTDGRVVRYRPSGAAIDSFSTAVGPTQFVF